MSTPQRWLVIVSLCVLAIGLSCYFIEYRSEPANDLHPPDGLILATTKSLAPPSYEKMEGLPKLPPGFRLDMQDGIYARPDHSTYVAAIGGVLIPFILLVAAGFLALGQIRKFRTQTNTQNLP